MQVCRKLIFLTCDFYVKKISFLPTFINKGVWRKKKYVCRKQPLQVRNNKENHENLLGGFKLMILYFLSASIL